MFERLPRPFEIALFAAMAVFCAAIVSLAPRHDSALFFAGIPLYFVCALIGLRHNERRARESEPVVQSLEDTAS